MRHRMVLLTAAIAVLAGYGTASAQGVDVQVYGGNPYYSSDRYYDGRYDRGPRVYGYRSDADVPDVAVQARPANCGQYRYWNGERCADARVNPPNLN